MDREKKFAQKKMDHFFLVLVLPLSLCDQTSPSMNDEGRWSKIGENK